MAISWGAERNSIKTIAPAKIACTMFRVQKFTLRFVYYLSIHACFIFIATHNFHVDVDLTKPRKNWDFNVAKQSILVSCTVIPYHNLELQKTLPHSILFSTLKSARLCSEKKVFLFLFFSSKELVFRLMLSYWCFHLKLFFFVTATKTIPLHCFPWQMLSKMSLLVESKVQHWFVACRRAKPIVKQWCFNLC